MFEVMIAQLIIGFLGGILATYVAKYKEKIFAAVKTIIEHIIRAIINNWQRPCEDNPKIPKQYLCNMYNTIQCSFIRCEDEMQFTNMRRGLLSLITYNVSQRSNNIQQHINYVQSLRYKEIIRVPFNMSANTLLYNLCHDLFDIIMADKSALLRYSNIFDKQVDEQKQSNVRYNDII